MGGSIGSGGVSVVREEYDDFGEVQRDFSNYWFWGKGFRDKVFLIGENRKGVGAGGRGVNDLLLVYSTGVEAWIVAETYRLDGPPKESVEAGISRPGLYTMMGDRVAD